MGQLGGPCSFVRLVCVVSRKVQPPPLFSFLPYPTLQWSAEKWYLSILTNLAFRPYFNKGTLFFFLWLCVRAIRLREQNTCPVSLAVYKRLPAQVILLFF